MRSFSHPYFTVLKQHFNFFLQYRLLSPTIVYPDHGLRNSSKCCVDVLNLTFLLSPIAVFIGLKLIKIVFKICDGHQGYNTEQNRQKSLLS